MQILSFLFGTEGPKYPSSKYSIQNISKSGIYPRISDFFKMFCLRYFEQAYFEGEPEQSLNKNANKKIFKIL